MFYDAYVNVGMGTKLIRVLRNFLRRHSVGIVGLVIVILRSIATENVRDSVLQKLEIAWITQYTAPS
jgi:hypothetical protein